MEVDKAELEAAKLALPRIFKEGRFADLEGLLDLALKVVLRHADLLEKHDHSLQQLEAAQEKAAAERAAAQRMKAAMVKAAVDLRESRRITEKPFEKKEVKKKARAVTPVSKRSPKHKQTGGQASAANATADVGLQNRAEKKQPGRSSREEQSAAAGIIEGDTHVTEKMKPPKENAVVPKQRSSVGGEAVTKDFSSDFDHNSPLHLALFFDHLDILKLLETKTSSDLVGTGKDGSTSLLTASLYGHMDLFQSLLPEANADVLAITHEGHSPLHLASAGGHLEIVQFLVTKTSPNLEAAGKNGFTPLLMASTYGHLDVCKYLVLEASADIQASNNIHNNPLHLASAGGHLAIVKFLVTKANAEVDAIGHNGITSLGHASFHGHLDVVKYLLLEAVADVEASNSFGGTALHLAASEGHLAIVQFLCREAAADILAADMHGFSPLACAFWSHRKTSKAIALAGDKDYDQVTRVARLKETVEFLKLWEMRSAAGLPMNDLLRD